MGNKGRPKKGESKLAEEAGQSNPSVDAIDAGQNNEESKEKSVKIGKEVAIQVPVVEPDVLKSKGAIDSSAKLKEKIIVDDTVDLGSSDGIVQIVASAEKTMADSRKLSWVAQSEKDASLPKPPTPPVRKDPPAKSYAEVVGNRDVQNGWKLEYIKPKVNGEAFITTDEWQRGSACWDKALVGYVMGFKPGFMEISAYAKSRWKADVKVN